MNLWVFGVFKTNQKWNKEEQRGRSFWSDLGRYPTIDCGCSNKVSYSDWSFTMSRLNPNNNVTHFWTSSGVVKFDLFVDIYNNELKWKP
jgi:hypothetical protein